MRRTRIHTIRHFLMLVGQIRAASARGCYYSSVWKWCFWSSLTAGPQISVFGLESGDQTRLADVVGRAEEADYHGRKQSWRWCAPVSPRILEANRLAREADSGLAAQRSFPPSRPAPQSPPIWQSPIAWSILGRANLYDDYRHAVLARFMGFINSAFSSPMCE